MNKIIKTRYSKTIQPQFKTLESRESSTDDYETRDDYDYETSVRLQDGNSR